MIDNFDLINSLLRFPDDDTIYHLQIIRRGKDHPNLPSANRTIKSYFVSSKDYLLKRKDEIIMLCEQFGARAYINLNPKSVSQATFNVISYLAMRAAEGDFKAIHRAWDTVVGSLKPNRKEARWIVDIDEPIHNDPSVEDALSEVWEKQFRMMNSEFRPSAEEIRQNFDKFIFAKIPTKHGHHLIVPPFNIQDFKEKYKHPIDIHRNNPTILYIPDFQSKTEKK